MMNTITMITESIHNIHVYILLRFRRTPLWKYNIWVLQGYILFILVLLIYIDCAHSFRKSHLSDS